MWRASFGGTLQCTAMQRLLLSLLAGLQASEFKRKRLNLQILLDVSGSMSEQGLVAGQSRPSQRQDGSDCAQRQSVRATSLLSPQFVACAPFRCLQAPRSTDTTTTASQDSRKSCRMKVQGMGRGRSCRSSTELPDSAGRAACSHYQSPPQCSAHPAITVSCHPFPASACRAGSNQARRC